MSMERMSTQPDRSENEAARIGEGLGRTRAHLSRAGLMTHRLFQAQEIHALARLAASTGDSPLFVSIGSLCFGMFRLAQDQYLSWIHAFNYDSRPFCFAKKISGGPLVASA